MESHGNQCSARRAACAFTDGGDTHFVYNNSFLAGYGVHFRGPVAFQGAKHLLYHRKDEHFACLFEPQA